MSEPLDVYAEQVKKAQDDYQSTIVSIADRVRQEIVLPACVKHKLTFDSGMGTYSFSKGRGTYVAESGTLWYSEGGLYPSKVVSAPRAMVEDLKAIIELLEEWVDEGGPLGSRMKDVTKEDVKNFKSAE